MGRTLLLELPGSGVSGAAGSGAVARRVADMGECHERVGVVELEVGRRGDPQRWSETLRINTVGPYLMSRAFMGGMIERGWGRIVNVSSAAAFGAPSGLNSVYALSKVALNHFTRQLAAEVANMGVTANAIHPGEVRTEMWEAIRDDSAARGPEAEGAMAWARLVDETGGDPPEKAVDLMMELVGPGSEATNGKFLWIHDGLQKPRATWE